MISEGMRRTLRFIAAEKGEALAAKVEGFAEMLLRRIREKGMDNAGCYAGAHVDRRGRNLRAVRISCRKEDGVCPYSCSGASF